MLKLFARLLPAAKETKKEYMGSNHNLNGNFPRKCKLLDIPKPNLTLLPHRWLKLWMVVVHGKERGDQEKASNPELNFKTGF